MSALLISMQGIANLAEVKRPAVTQWQTRFPSTSATPFPQPVETDPLLKFDAREVARWLIETGMEITRKLSRMPLSIVNCS